MKKRILTLCMAFILCFLGGMSVSVTAEATQEKTIPEERQLPRLVDDADILSTSEEEELLGTLDEISERQQCDVAVVTIESLEGSDVTAYADDFYDYNGYGMGSGDDGILFLIAMEERDWAISTHGYGITAFTDAGLDYMEERFLSDLSDGYYLDSFMTYATLCDEFITQANTGTPYDNSNLPKEPFSQSWIWKSLIIGAIIAFIITGYMRLQLRSVNRQLSATNYVKDGSMNLAESRDMFLYRRVTRTAKPKDDGGSSTHSSSSGRSHGGSSGGF